MFFGADHVVPGAPRSLDEYTRLFAACRTDQIAGEASANYLYSECAANEIKDCQPNARIVIMLRNPVHMMHSLHSQLVLNGDEPERDFATALGMEKARRSGSNRPPDTQLYQSLLYRHVADYPKHLGRFIDVFGLDKMHIVVLEHFIERKEDCYLALLAFLGVVAILPDSWTVENQNKQTRFVGLRTVSQHPRVKAAARAIVPRRLRHEIDAAIRHWNSRVMERVPVPQDLARQLHHEFAPSVSTLSRMINRDLSCWSSAT